MPCPITLVDLSAPEERPSRADSEESRREATRPIIWPKSVGPSTAPATSAIRLVTEPLAPPGHIERHYDGAPEGAGSSPGCNEATVAAERRSHRSQMT